MKLSIEELNAVKILGENTGFQILLKFLQTEINSIADKMKVPQGAEEDLRLLNLWRGYNGSLTLLNTIISSIDTSLKSLSPEEQLAVEAGRKHPPEFKVFDNFFDQMSEPQNFSLL